MKQTPEISIITVNYNGFNDTCDLLDSVQEHLHTLTYEVIVVDNGSRKMRQPCSGNVIRMPSFSGVNKTWDSPEATTWE